jgi:Ca2+-binding RTX toxin-like protein
MSNYVDILPPASAGLVDEIGNGLADQNGAEYWSIPSSMLSQPQSQWSVVQWGQTPPINSSDYQTNDSNAYDSLYGNALYNWSTSSSNDAVSIYKTSSAFPYGNVYQLINVNPTFAPTGGSFESDLMITSFAIANGMGTLSHPINISLDAKLLKSYFAANAGRDVVPANNASSNLGIGFTIGYNGAGDLPKYSGFVQIDLWNSYTDTQTPYETAPISPDPNDASQFISTLTIGNDPRLPLLPSDASAQPETLTYNVNNYVYATLKSAFAGFTTAQKANLLNLANWTIGSVYVGSSVYDANSETSTDNATITSTVQVSNVQLTEDPTQTYNPDAPVASVAAVDPNPTISFFDNTTSDSGSADASIYSGSIPGIQYEYIYQSSDNVALTIPADGNWMVGGGGGMTEITAISGNNILVASTGSSLLNGGSGNDTFDIPDANLVDKASWDTIENFHAGDSAVLAGGGSANWTYTWNGSMGAAGATGLTLVAMSNSNAGLSEAVTFAGLGLNDLSHLVISQDQSTGNLTISSNSDPTKAVIGLYDVSTGSTAYEMGSSVSSSNGVQATYLYQGSASLAILAPEGTNWEFGGGSGPTALVANSGNNVLVASTGGSFMTGGSGNNDFVIPQLASNVNSSWDDITDFQVGDSVTLKGLSSSKWRIGWLNDAGPVGNDGLTLYAINNANPNLTEMVTFAGLDTGDLTHMATTQSPNGDVTIVSNNNGIGPVILTYDETTGKSGYQVSSAVSTTNHSPYAAEYLYTGDDQMNFIAPAGVTWKFGGGSGLTALTAQKGNNVLVASTGGSWMTGGSGNNTFELPAISVGSQGPHDVIMDFHAGDVIEVYGSNSSAWTTKWLPTSGLTGVTGETLAIMNPQTKGVFESISFNGIQNASAISVAVASGASGGLIISSH